MSCLTTFWSPNHSSHFPSESNYQSIYKKLKQLKLFLTKIGPAIPLTEARLVSPKSLTKERGRLVSSMFPTKILILFIPAISYTHTPYIHVLLSFSTYFYFLFHIHSSIIRVIIYFGRIIIDIIIFDRKRKMCIIFGRKINNIIA